MEDKPISIRRGGRRLGVLERYFTENEVKTQMVSHEKNRLQL